MMFKQGTAPLMSPEHWLAMRALPDEELMDLITANVHYQMNRFGPGNFNDHDAVEALGELSQRAKMETTDAD